ncbi:MAG TPA: LacI family transcriptional regulator [Enterococcus columbae]|nr:LacI family transcriptional regulator [Enterococcus columbae]
MTKSKESITMKDVAQLAGVSVGTVSRVVNNESGIKQSTLKKVKAAIKELNYIPNAYARGMKKNQTSTIGLIVPTIWHPFFSEFAQHIGQLLASRGYKTLLCNIGQYNSEVEIIQMLEQNKVDGIIAITYSPIESYLSTDIPFVSIDRTYTDKHIACVSADNALGATIAAEKLIEKGGTHFAFVGSYNKTINETKKRRQYFEKTILDAELPFVAFDLEEPFTDFKAKLHQFLLDNPFTDAIFAINDFTALDVIEELKVIGKKVPENVQVIGFDGIKMAIERNSPVTTIRQPLESMAQKAVELIIQKIGGESPKKLQYILPVTYIEGPTTKN